MADKKNILYFDDEPFISGALAQNLELYDWNVTLVEEIKDLFEKLNNAQYDILILDIMAPTPDKENEHVSFTSKEIDEMRGGTNSGIVAAKKIWKLNKNIPILFLSARQKPDSISQFKEEGKKCEFLRKPELAKTIHNTLKNLLN